MIICVISFILAASCNAVMDMSFNMWGSSVFAKNPHIFNPNFWNLKESSKYAKRIFGTAIDAWHVAKFLMLGFIQTSMVTFNVNWLWILIFPIIWGVSFEISKYFLTSK